jgi:parvulin-like peptidyl-prolyl isomerase
MRVVRPAQVCTAIVGLLLALSGAIVAAPRGADDAGAPVACVNGAPIRAAALERALARHASAQGHTAEPALRAALIEKLVDEELLVQRAAEIELVTADRGVRKALVRAAIDAAVREAAARPASERELRAFHAEHAELFARPRRVRVRAIAFAAGRDPDAALQRAQQASAAIAGGLAFETAAARFGDRPGLPLPDALLPEPVLRRQLGPSLSEAALRLEPGALSAPLRVGASVVLLELAEVEPARAQPFEAAQAQVAGALARRRGDEALADLLARLRAQARIARAPEPPGAHAAEPPAP